MILSFLDEVPIIKKYFLTSRDTVLGHKTLDFIQTWDFIDRIKLGLGKKWFLNSRNWKSFLECVNDWNTVVNRGEQCAGWEGKEGWRSLHQNWEYAWYAAARWSAFWGKLLFFVLDEIREEQRILVLRLAINSISIYKNRHFTLYQKSIAM